MFKFLHTGDLHLDSPFAGLTTVAPESIAATLRDSTLLAWNRIIDLALEEQVQFLLVAGDAFENANRTLQGQIHFRDGLAKLSAAGIDSFVVTGNHDPESGWSPSVTWPERAYRFGASKVESRPVVRDGVELARVHGIGYRTRDVGENLVARFKAAPDAPFNIGLLHTNVGADPSAGNYAPCSIGDLRRSGMDYWALGHIHRHRIISAERPVAVYCGNPQGRDPGETEPRGCYVVTVDSSGVIHPEFRPTDVVRWQMLKVPITRLTTEEAMVDAVAHVVDEARSTADRSIVARVTLTGRGPMHHSLAKTGVLRDVAAVARERLGEAAPFAWIESVRDDTRSELDLASRAKADDFLGSVLRLFSSTRDAAEAAGSGETGAEDETGVPPMDPALERALDELYANERARRYLGSKRPTGKALAGVLEAAETMVVDQLADEG